jgi:hypothetical protein
MDAASVAPLPVLDLLSSSSSLAAPASSSAAPSTIHDINLHLRESQALDGSGQEQASERAFKAFVRAVHALQSLELQGDTVPQVSPHLVTHLGHTNIAHYP